MWGHQCSNKINSKTTPKPMSDMSLPGPDRLRLVMPDLIMELGRYCRALSVMPHFERSNVRR